MNIRLGLFDSGVGGFTVLKRVIERHGDLECVYLGDLARMPYGAKSISEIRTIAFEVMNWLNEQDLSAVLVACNTTNSLALDIVKKYAKVPVLSLIEAVREIKTFSRIGVLATPATVDSKAYSKQILEFNSNAYVLEQACPAFVPLIETGQFNSAEIRKVANEYLKPLLEDQVEAIILGCSHYPLLIPLLKELLPSTIQLIDPSIGIASDLDRYVGNSKLCYGNPISFSNTRFCVTADACGFATRAMYWLNKYPEVELVSLQSKACVF